MTNLMDPAANATYSVKQYRKKYIVLLESEKKKGGGLICCTAEANVIKFHIWTKIKSFCC